MKPNSLIRWTTIAAVVLTAVVAGWASYAHAYQIVTHYGEQGIVARLYPGTIDGLVYSTSMVKLDAARRKVAAHPLTNWLLAAGILATLSANLWAGWHFGAAGALIAAWPAPALVGSYEMLMLLIRGQAADVGPVIPSVPDRDAEPPRPPAAEAPPNPSPGGPPAPKRHRHAAGVPTPEAAEQAFQPELAKGEIPAVPLIMKKLHVGKTKAEIYHAHFERITQALR